MGLVMKLSDKEFNSKSKVLGAGSALMIISGYYGELFVSGDLTPRWICFLLSMSFFLYVVYELLVGLGAATDSETDANVRSKIQAAQMATVVSWTTHPVRWWAFRLAIVHLISYLNVELVCSFTRLPSPSPTRREHFFREGSIGMKPRRVAWQFTHK